MRVWDVRLGAEVRRLGVGSYLYSACFSPDGRCVVSTSSNGALVVWDLNRRFSLVAAEVSRALYGGGQSLMPGVLVDLIARYAEFATAAPRGH